MGTSSQTERYCAAFGNGKFIVRGFGPEPFRMTGLLSGNNAAIHKAAGRPAGDSGHLALGKRR